ncbi:DUF550 domain-containing protein [Klebsiella pneumoniae]|uniref:DUF550 domain-containing protein n=1 Tax=Klebsiella pneumoniae TaxID=573 RepID=UPI000E2D5C52|nr:DUF550 domain-containing protein [Klebsiella pneumoniae]SVS98016.1 Uncharacterised protein [Klebsiella pneumoniae]SWU15031.1 Uncharacterised protein [Klebsiella pneumoniae]
MTKSTITRERLQEIAEDGFLKHGESKELARMALAAMDSEPVGAPEPISFDEWSRKCALQITLCYPDFREKAKYIWDSARETQQLVPALVVPDDVLDALQKVARIRLDLNDFDGDRRGIADCLCDAEEALIEVVNRCAAMLHAGDTVRDLSTPVDPQVAEYEQNVMQDGNSPAIPDGYVMVPMRLTAENGAKGVLSGEFSETKFVNCPECFGDDECETCDGSGRIEIKVPVSWTTIKDIWIKGVEHFAAAPQEVKGE